jgi:hypothetical protein
VSLFLLLDEHLSPRVAAQCLAKNASLRIQSVHHWRAEFFLGKGDDRLLAAAAEESLTLLTYDQQTIPSLLAEMALLGQSHGGVIFVDDATIASSDIGSLVKAVLTLWEQCHAWDWMNRVLFLRRAP